MAAIFAPTSSVARCSVCGVQFQFHVASAVPHSADRDHEFVAETIDDFEPGDLSSAQLVDAIAGASERYRKVNLLLDMTDADWNESDHHAGRMNACRAELKSRVRAVFGVDFDELMGAIEG